MSEKVFYTLYDPKKNKDIGGRYSANKGSVISAAKKAAKSDHVFPEKKEYSKKKIYLRRMDGVRTEEKMNIFCYEVSQTMINAPPAYTKLTGVKGKIRKVDAKPCKE
jgi:hypothetical protein